MSKPLHFYTSEKQFFKKGLAIVNRKLLRLSMLRLAVFLSLVFLAWFFFGIIKVLVPVFIIGIALFLYLVSIYSDLKLLKKKTQKLIEINQLEIDVQEGDFSKLDVGNEFINPSHDFSYDIDLFGKGSFFQYINRTSLNTGKEELASVLTKNTVDAILIKQEAIKELSSKPKWRQNFTAIGSLIHVDVSIKTIVKWLHQHRPFVPKIMRNLPNIFAVVSVLFLGLNYFDFISNYGLALWFFIGLGVTGAYLKKINNLYLHANKAKDTFRQYHQLLSLIEKETFNTELLKQKQQEIKTEVKKASEIFLEFSKILDSFDQRNNMIIGVFANALALRDLHHCYKIEQWMHTNLNKIESWFEVIAFFDAQNSLANFNFNHPSFAFPKIIETNNSIEAEDLGHPLLSEEKRVTSSVTIKDEEFFIITGANMAGKSTFLRTVSLSIVMANIGLPICAKSFNYSPIKLITSMRTSDSLSDDESYFFSELKRLKYIVDKIKDQKYFIILDEILKGTNSTDKAKGSRKFVKRLVDFHATGIIATHDLSLCDF